MSKQVLDDPLDEILAIDAARSFDYRLNYGNFVSNLQFIEQTHVVTPEKCMLEIGTGRGALMKYLISIGYEQIQGVEKEAQFIHEGFELFGRLPIIRVNSEILPFKDNSFDVVMSFDTFEHLPNTHLHLQEVKRVLRPGGYYILQTPNKWTNTLFETIRWRSFTAWRQEHCSLHAYDELRRHFAQYDFSIEFFDIPIVNEYFKRKLKRYTSVFGLWMLKIVNPDRLPLSMRPNFFIKGRQEN